jgi:hypothetical protein
MPADLCVVKIKNQLNQTIMKSLKTVFIRTACMLFLVSLSNSFNITQAQAKVQTQAVAANETSGSIRFVQAEGDMLVFELHFTNLPAKGSKLRIIDGDNNTLLEQNISTEIYNIRYKIVKGEISKINFEVSGKKLFLNQSFTIKSRTEEKIEVTGV